MPAGWIGLFAVGLCLGWLGAGGTSLALPALVYGMGLPVHQAISASLVLVGGASAFGAALHGRRGAVRWGMAACVAPFGLAGAALGASWSYLMSGRALLLTFGAMLLLIGARMWREGPLAPGSCAKWILLAPATMLIGTLTGLLGNGGGFLLVPTLIAFGGLAVREAMATSLVVIALNSAVAFGGHSAHQRLPYLWLAGMLGVALLGMLAGVELSHRTSPQRLKRGFALVLLVLGLSMIWGNR